MPGDADHDVSSNRNLITFYVITLAVTWGIGGGLVALNPGAISASLLFFLGSGPTIAALVVTAWTNGATGVVQLVGAIFRRCRWYWLLAACILQPLATVIVAVTDALITSDKINVGKLDEPLFLVMGVIVAEAVRSGPLGEELGWRGFALPRLLARTSPLIASLIVGALWIIWHLPIFLFGLMGIPTSQFGWFALSDFALSILMTGLYMRANGSVLVAGIIPHFVGNALFALGLWTYAPGQVIMLSIMALIVVLSDHRGWLRSDNWYEGRFAISSLE